MLRRLGIRAKVLAVLAVPMIVVLAAGGYISWGAFERSRTASAVAQMVQAVEQYAPVVATVQRERAVSLAPARQPADVAAARRQTDAALAKVEPLLAAIDLDALDRSVVGALQDVRFAHGTQLAGARQNVDLDGQSAIIQRTYDNIIGSQIGLVRTVATTIDDRQVGAYMAAYGDIANLSENLAREELLGTSLLLAPEISEPAARDFAAQAATAEVSRDTARNAVAALGVRALRLPTGDPTPEFQQMRTLLSTGSPQARSQVDPGTWTAAFDAQRVPLVSVRTDLLGQAASTADLSAASERRTALLTVGIALAAAAVSFALALIVSRGLVRPLRRLTAAASEVREELPQLVEQVAVPGASPSLEIVQIPVETRDEIGRLAEAFNSVNETTIRVAQQQAALRGSIAEMFVSVARRDQVLLNRQLSFIDSLEGAEEDPAVLANLFRLDHLATRMRRNAESLLVLAGIDSGRRLRDPLPLSDVIRSASSEIEQYERVRLELVVDPPMLGFHALSAAHLLAELLENATVFSEPATPVVVRTGADDVSVSVTVTDEGLGMSDAELAAANAKVRSTDVADALGAQRLGLFVVGRLTRRLGAQVTLEHSTAGRGGTVARVEFPRGLFSAADPAMPGLAGAWHLGIAGEPPVVERVDVGTLTDGQTSRGLPRRRRPDGTPVPEHTARSVMLPAPVQQLLSPELSVPGDRWSPQVAPTSGDGLPSRTSVRPTAPAVPAPVEQVAAAPERRPVAPADRAGLFSAFRGRSARRGDTTDPEAGASEPTSALELQPRTAAPQAPTEAAAVPGMMVPGLVPDDDEPGPRRPPSEPWQPSEMEPAVGVRQTPDLEPRTSQMDVAEEVWALTPHLDEARAWNAWRLEHPESDLDVPVPPRWSGVQPTAEPAATPGGPVAAWQPPAPLPAEVTLSAAPTAVPAAPEAAPAEPEVVARWVATDAAPGPAEGVPGPADADGVPGPAEGVPGPADGVPLTSAFAPAAGPAQRAVVAVPQAAGPMPVLAVTGTSATPALSDTGPRRRRLFGRRGRRGSAAVGDQTPAPAAVATVGVVGSPAAAAPAWLPTTPGPETSPVPGSVGPQVSAQPAPWSPRPAGSVDPGVSSTPASRAGQDWEHTSSGMRTLAAWAPAPEATAEWAGAGPGDGAARALPTRSAPSPAVTRPSASEWTPRGDDRAGAPDLAAAATLALRADIQQQALAELSQLSTYRPQVAPDGAALVRRVPQATGVGAPVPETALDHGHVAAPRDADQLRSRLSSFQSGTVRGRRAATHADGDTRPGNTLVDDDGPAVERP